MERPQPRRPSPFSLRLSHEERARLEARAGDLALGRYIRMRLLDETGGHGLKAVAKVQDQAALARVLAQLGASRLSSNLNQLARAANAGALPVTPEIEAALQAACAEVRAMRADLLQALGARNLGDTL